MIRQPWTPQMDKILKRLWPIFKPRYIASELGIKTRDVVLRAQFLGLE